MQHESPVSLMNSANATPGNASIPAIPPGVRITTLENGLTVIVKEDHSAPVVSAQAWCMAGSIHEGKWLGGGLSHVLEHMLFKGTTTRPGSRIDQEVQEAGGYMNAYTSFDRTVYHIDVPNTGAQTAISILCDIMQNATLPADEMAKEKEVILREMDMNVDDPGRRAGRRLFETAYTKSPYRFTIIGYPDIFNELKPQDVLAYYHEKYPPNNVFYTVVGDIRTDDVLAQIGKAYSSAKARPMPPMVLPEEPRQTAPREVIEEAPIELGYFHFSWHIPDLRHKDIPALDVLGVLLGQGRSSRLFQQVREKKGLVHSVDAWTYSPGNPGLFGVSATADSGQVGAAREAMLDEVEKMKDTAAAPAELVKAVKQFVSGTLATRKTMTGQAQDLGGSWLAANDLNFSQRYLAAVKALTPDDVQRVAREYLTAENQTVYALLPAGSVKATAVQCDAALDRPVEKFELSNGLKLLVKEDHRLPFVEFRAVFQAGVLAETIETSGLTVMTGRLLLKGTTKHSAEELAREIESVGGSLDSYGGNNSAGINSEVLSSDLTTGLDLMAEVILEPSFPAAELERERQIQLAALRAQKDQLLQSAFRAVRRSLYGDGGYGLDPLGTEPSVQAMQVDSLKTFHARFAVPDNCVLAVYGDVKPGEIRQAIDERFGKWARGPQPFARAGYQPAANRTVRRADEKRDKKQAVIVVAFRGVSLRDPERYALELVQEACSDLGSRLFMRIRERLGLAYFVGAQNFVGLVPGFFAFYAGTAPEKRDLVEKELLNEAELLRAEGLTEEELHRAKAKLIGQKKIARQDLGHLAMTQALDELYGLGYAHSDTEDALFEAVTLEQVRAVARKYLTPDSYAVSVMSPGTAQ